VDRGARDGSDRPSRGAAASPGVHGGRRHRPEPAALLTSNGGGFADLFVPIGLGNFTLPLLIGPRLRIEPELGFTRVSSRNESPDGAFSSRTSSTLLRYGLGVGAVIIQEGGFRSHTGIRFGLSRFSQNVSVTSPFGSSETGSKRTDSYFGVALGGEYFLARRFSLGGEFQLTRMSLGDVEVEGLPPGSGVTDSTVWSTNGLIAVRFHLL
jgi:opacity protein-like surface antigen